jgi:opacity protein-like surface antigen
MKTLSVSLLAFLFFTAILIAQDDPLQNSIGVDVRYNSDSRIFPEPFSSDPIARNSTDNLGDFFSYAVHYRRSIVESVEIQLTGEYLSHQHETADNFGTITKDGFSMVGLELLGLFRLPFSSSTFALYTGGGGGFVYGERSYSIAGVEAETLDKDLSFGIHVLIGLEYFFRENLSLRGEFHFRDPTITSEDVFRQETIQANGILYTLPTTAFPSKINLDGNVYSLGISWHF